MARGERGKRRPQGSGLAIGSLFGALCLAALTLVVSTTGSCGGCDGCLRAWVMPPPVVEPFAGAGAAIDELSWRDVGRARASYMRPSVPDAAGAAAALRSALGMRGYVLATTTPQVATLPFETRTPELAGGCGVVAIAGLGNATLSGVEGPEGHVAASDPSVVALGVCGDGSLRVAGIGSATVEIWDLPGITPQDVAATGLPVDVVLAHAEAEVLWRARGWAPSDHVVRVEHARGPATWASPPGSPPARGCIAWVGVAIGAGSAETATRFSAFGRDYAIDRALFGGLACGATAATHTTLTDAERDGFVVYWRPYGGASSGPTRAPVAVDVARSAGALRVVDVGDLSLPETIAETTPP